MLRDIKIHRLLLVMGFVYLTMCPHSGEVTDGLFDYSAIGSRIQSLDSRQQRECDHSAPAVMTVWAPGGSTVAPETAGLFIPVSENPHTVSTDPLFGSKLRL